MFILRSSTRGPEDDSVESKHVAPLWHYMFILPLLCLTELHPPLEYVILIAFGQQQWLHERAPMLCYTYIACIVGTWLAVPFVAKESCFVTYSTATAN